jgi:hypothetical protein
MHQPTYINMFSYYIIVRNSRIYLYNNNHRVHFYFSDVIKMSFHVVNKRDVRLFLTEFLNNNTIKTLEQAQDVLKAYKNKKFSDFSLANSRNLHMSVLLYKFKEEVNTGENMWQVTRNMIFAILRQDANQDECIHLYLVEFKKWKDSDLDNLVLEIAAIYYNLVQIRKSIDDSNEMTDDTQEEWAPHLQQLMQKIVDSCNELNIFQKVLQHVAYFEQQKSEMVYTIMSKAYWDSIETDLSHHQYDLFFRNLEELKMNLLSILPKRDARLLAEFHDKYDIEFIKQRISLQVFDKDYLVSFFTYVVSLLQDADSIQFIPNYDHAIRSTLEAIADTDISKSTRMVMEKICMLSENLRNRKAIWEKLLFSNTP